jgi:RNA polymerase sigma factor (TIGR02999 family)
MNYLATSDWSNSLMAQPAGEDFYNTTTFASSAVNEPFSKVYDELRKLARRELRRGSKHTLYTTELVHEIYMKICLNDALTFENDARFYNYAAIAMRHILIDRATRRARVKFGGDLSQVDLTDPELNKVTNSPALALALDAALRRLEVEDPRAAKVVELHYFAGLPLARVAELIGVTRRTIDRDWSFARAFLGSNVPEGVDSTY